jgi:putative glutamine amidotransferase
MTLPLIGITSRTATVPPSPHPTSMVQKSYTDAILFAGGLPVLIPSDIKENGWKDLVNRLDGILFPGGGDIAIEYFHGTPHPAVYGIEAARDAIELGLVREAIAAKVPFLGICRGLQIVNVAMGGTLYTHIPDQLPHALVHDYPGDDSIKSRTALLHPVSIEAGSHLAKVLNKTELLVNSLHHQGIKDVAPDAMVVAHAPDGLVEGIELPEHPFGMAVQWHPEWLTDQEPIRCLFKAFVDAAAECRKLRDAK